MMYRYRYTLLLSRDLPLYTQTRWIFHFWSCPTLVLPNYCPAHLLCCQLLSCQLLSCPTLILSWKLLSCQLFFLQAPCGNRNDGMTESNPGYLPQKPGALPMSHHNCQLLACPAHTCSVGMLEFNATRVRINGAASLQKMPNFCTKKTLFTFHIF